MPGGVQMLGEGGDGLVEGGLPAGIGEPVAYVVAPSTARYSAN
jgi:hypothetical protein